MKLYFVWQAKNKEVNIKQILKFLRCFFWDELQTLTGLIEGSLSVTLQNTWEFSQWKDKVQLY